MRPESNIALNVTFLPPLIDLHAPTKPALSLKEQIAGKNDGAIDRDEIRRRAGNAMARKLPHFLRCENTAREWAIIGGGPSLTDHYDVIRALKKRGVNIVSVNKTHDDLLEHGIVPWGHILLDPKERVAEYVQRPRMDVRYFVASQCHDKTFDALEGYPVFLWHAGQDFDEGTEPYEYLKTYWSKSRWFIVPGPTTVGLRAPLIGHILGADKFHLIALDSSRDGMGNLHAYPKDEMKEATSGSFVISNRGYKAEFQSNSHMLRQVYDFDRMIEELPMHYAAGRYRPEFELTVYGSGMLPFLAATMGLHADPECNFNPKKVGGYYSTDPTEFLSMQTPSIIDKITPLRMSLSS